MRAIRYDRYGGPEVIELREEPLPEPGAGRVRLRVDAASVNPFEWHFLRGLPYLMRPRTGWSRPRATWLGVDVAGVVDAVGPGVMRFAPGDRVFGIAAGSLAEFALAREENLAAIPDDADAEQAAGLPLAGLTALQGLELGGIAPGARVLVLGSSGGVGHYAVQIARALGAARVVAVCGPRNTHWVAALGADRVLDYQREDPATLGERFDVILDIAGGTPIAAQRALLAPGGTVVLVGGPGDGRLLGPASRIFAARAGSALRRERVELLNARWDGDDLARLGRLLGEGRLRTVIDRVEPLERTAEAIAYLEEGHARGKVIVRPR